MRRLPLFLVLIAVLSAIFAAPAGADPKTEPLELTCEGVPSGVITTNGNGTWTPGHATASTGNYIPYKFEFSFMFLPEEGDPIDFGTETAEKKNVPKNTRSHAHGVCHFTDTEDIVDDPDLGTGTFVFMGTAYVFWTDK